MNPQLAELINVATSDLPRIQTGPWSRQFPTYTSVEARTQRGKAFFLHVPPYDQMDARSMDAAIRSVREQVLRD